MGEIIGAFFAFQNLNIIRWSKKITIFFYCICIINKNRRLEYYKLNIYISIYFSSNVNSFSIYV
jgi:hypothetical protein